MTTAPVGALLIVNYGSHALIEENLTRTRLPDGAVVVIVDNYSDAGELESLRAVADRHDWLVVASPRNLGFGGGMNLAAEHARRLGATRFIALNPDASLGPGAAAALFEQVRADPRRVVAPLVLRPDGQHFASRMELDLARGAIRRALPGRRYDRSALWLSGACFAIDAELFDRVGGFDDDYFLYWEDVDLSIRLADAGAMLGVDETIRAIHDPGGTQPTAHGAKSAGYYYYNVRNRLVFAARHLDARDRRRWWRHTPSETWRVLSRGGRRHLLHPRRSVLPALRGVVDGLRYRAPVAVGMGTEAADARR